MILINSFVTSSSICQAVKIYSSLLLLRKREFHNSGDGMRITTALEKVYQEIYLMQNVIRKSERCVSLHDVLIVESQFDLIDHNISYEGLSRDSKTTS